MLFDIQILVHVTTKTGRHIISNGYMQCIEHYANFVTFRFEGWFCGYSVRFGNYVNYYVYVWVSGLTESREFGCGTCGVGETYVHTVCHIILQWNQAKGRRVWLDKGTPRRAHTLEHQTCGAKGCCGGGSLWKSVEAGYRT